MAPYTTPTVYGFIYHTHCVWPHIPHPLCMVSYTTPIVYGHIPHPLCMAPYTTPIEYGPIYHTHCVWPHITHPLSMAPYTTPIEYGPTNIIYFLNYVLSYYNVHIHYIIISYSTKGNHKTYVKSKVPSRAGIIYTFLISILTFKLSRYRYR